jgi:succinate dehydrogenase hydrophobic anchor subunit
MRDARFWGLHMASAVVLLALLGLHMVIMHLDGTLALINPAWGQPLAWNHVLARARSAFFTATYVLMLTAALFHGLYGLCTMVTELTENRTVRKITSISVWTGGGLLFILGAYAIIAMHLMGT